MLFIARMRIEIWELIKIIHHINKLKMKAIYSIHIYILYIYVCVYLYTYICIYINIYMISMDGASQVVLVVKNLPANTEDTRDVGSIPGSGRFPGVGNDGSVLYSCLENSMERRSRVDHRATKSQTWLSNWARINGYRKHFDIWQNLTYTHDFFLISQHTRNKKELS